MHRIVHYLVGGFLSLCAFASHAGVIAHSFEFYLSGIPVEFEVPVFTGSFSGINADMDDFLELDELNQFSITFNGSLQTPGLSSFTLGLNDLSSFVFTPARPLNVVGALYSSPGEPDLLNLSAFDGSSSIGFSIDAWRWSSAGISRSSFGGGGQLTPGEMVPIPATGPLFGIAIVLILILRGRKLR